jgi:hypothetical protein
VPFFEKIAILCFWGRLKGRYFWIWNVHLSRIDSWILNMGTIRPTVQALPRRTSIHCTCRQHREKHFFAFCDTKTCKSVKIMRKVVFSITIPSYIWYEYLEVTRDLQRRQVKIHWSIVLSSYGRSRFTQAKQQVKMFPILYILILIFLGWKWEEKYAWLTGSKYSTKFHCEWNSNLLLWFILVYT